MIDIKNIDYKPSIEEMSAYINNPLFNEFYEYLNNEYQPLIAVEYSKDSWLKGWNIKFRKAGRALCVAYPKENYFTVLVVIGRKEKERVEAQLTSFSPDLQKIYQSTTEGMGQRWLMIDLHQQNQLYSDVQQLIRIRRENK